MRLVTDVCLWLVVGGAYQTIERWCPHDALIPAAGVKLLWWSQTQEALS